MLSASLIKYLRHGDGGSVEKLHDYLENYDANQEDRKYSFSLETGKLLHAYLEDPDNFVVASFSRPSDAIVDMVTAEAK